MSHIFLNDVWVMNTSNSSVNNDVGLTKWYLYTRMRSCNIGISDIDI